MRGRAELARAAQGVGGAHGPAVGLLNARAAAFIPRMLHVEDCAVLLDHPRRQVLGAPLDQVFLMKLYAARDRDLDDLRALWALRAEFVYLAGLTSAGRSAGRRPGDAEAEWSHG